MGEVVDDKPFEYYLELARTAPKVATDDPRIESDGHYSQFGNNFINLWQLLRLEAPHDEGGAYDRYVGLAKSQPGWETFTGTNTELIGQINEALDLLIPYEELLAKLKEIWKKRDDEAEAQLETATEHPLGCEAIRMYAWDHLNPLFAEAAARMKDFGIDPKIFY